MNNIKWLAINEMKWNWFHIGPNKIACRPFPFQPFWYFNFVSISRLCNKQAFRNELLKSLQHKFAKFSILRILYGMSLMIYDMIWGFHWTSTIIENVDYVMRLRIYEMIWGLGWKSYYLEISSRKLNHLTLLMFCCIFQFNEILIIILWMCIWVPTLPSFLSYNKIEYASSL